MDIVKATLTGVILVLVAIVLGTLEIFVDSFNKGWQWLIGPRP